MRRDRRRGSGSRSRRRADDLPCETGRPRDQLAGELRSHVLASHDDDRLRAKRFGAAVRGASVTPREARRDRVAALREESGRVPLNRRRPAAQREDRRDDGNDRCGEPEEHKRTGEPTTPQGALCVPPGARAQPSRSAPVRSRDGALRRFRGRDRLRRRCRGRSCLAARRPARLHVERRRSSSRTSRPPGSRLLGLYQGVPLTRRGRLQRRPCRTRSRSTAARSSASTAPNADRAAGGRSGASSCTRSRTTSASATSGCVELDRY